MRTYVRFRPSSALNSNQTRALKLLAEHGEASVARRATAVEDATLTIHTETALSLIGHGVAEPSDNDGVAITEKGLRKTGKLRETPAQRRAQQAARALEAQASGKWEPAPAGASAQAERDAASARREWARARADVGAKQEEVYWARRMLRLAREWDGSEAEIAYQLEELGAAEARLAEAKAELERLRQQQTRAA